MYKSFYKRMMFPVIYSGLVSRISKSKKKSCLLGSNATVDASLCSAGDDRVSQLCNPTETHPCPMWTDWSEWSTCSVSCGQGRRNRGRECATPTFRNGRYFCEGGPNYQEEDCQAGACPQWSTWGDWSECSRSCGGGTKTKYRQCPVGLG